jgi:serine protease AprX
MLLKRLGRKIFLLGIILLLLISPSSTPTAQSTSGSGNGKVADDVEKLVSGASSPDALIPVIVQTAADPSGAMLSRLNGLGGSLKVVYSSIHGYAAKVPASQIDSLASGAEITRVSFDAPVKAHMDVAYPTVKADRAFFDFGLTGAGVGVAVVDTGIAGHPDLTSSKNLLNTLVDVSVIGKSPGLYDPYGHGTHVAGIIAGSGASSTGSLYYRTFKGIAPGARIIGVQALQADGSGYTSDVISAIDWVVKNKSAYNIRVMNLSLGHPVYESYTTDPLCLAVRAANDAGIVVVVAAGNEGMVGTGFGTIDSPGNEPTAITVGAMDDSNTVNTQDDVLAPFSSKGPTLVDHVVKPDLVAPGTSIVSLRDTNSFLDLNYHSFTLKFGDYSTDPLTSLLDGVYYRLSGTSMAAPMVAGAAALMIQKDPTLNPATVKVRLMTSADKDGGFVFETGAGYLNVDAALKASGRAVSAPSPLSLLYTDHNVYMQDTSLIWGAAYTAQVVYGFKKGSNRNLTMSAVNATVQGYTLIWGMGISDTAGTDSYIWNNAVTGSSLIWTFDASILAGSSGTVDNDAAVWGGHH